MFLADDVVMSPIKSILWVFREIHKAAVEQMATEADDIRTELSQLYLALEAGELSEEAFDAREGILLDRLDAIEDRGPLEAEEDEEGEEDEGDEDDWEVTSPEQDEAEQTTLGSSLVPTGLAEASRPRDGPPGARTANEAISTELSP